MSKAKRVLGYILVTSVIWVVARFIPSLIGELAPDSALLSMFAFFIMLPTGWVAAKTVSKGKYDGCVRANLYVFAVIEISGLIETLTYLLMNSSNVTVTAIYSGTVLCQIIYIVLCFIFAKTMKAQRNEDPAVNVEEGEREPVENGKTVARGSETVITEIVSAADPKPPKAKKQRYCKYCGGAIDTETKKCSNCGKQYFRFRIKKRAVFTAIALTAIVGLTVLNVYQYNQSQNTISSLKNIILELEEKTDSLEEEVSSQSKTITSQIKTITIQEQKLANLEDKANNYDDICKYLKTGNIGFAGDNFKSDESVIVVRKSEKSRKFTLTANWSGGGSVSVSYSSNAASISFDEDSWYESTTVTVKPHSEGVTVVTFGNDVDSKTFKVLIIVID